MDSGSSRLATGLDVIKRFVRSIGLDDLNPAAIATHLNPGDMKAAWQNGLADEIARAFEEQLRLLQLQGDHHGPGADECQVCRLSVLGGLRGHGGVPWRRREAYRARGREGIRGNANVVLRRSRL